MNNTIHKPIAITTNLFQLGLPSFPVYLSIGEEGMLIEGGTGPTTDMIVEQIQMLGIDPSKIKYIALTHTHTDHVGSVPRLRQRWPHLKIISGQIAAKFLKKDRFIKGFLNDDQMISDILIERGDITNPPPEMDDYDFKADIIMAEGDQIDLGRGIVWQAQQTPGHSPCHMSYFEKKEHTLALGDMTGYFDPERDVFWPNYFASLEDYCNSIRKIAPLQASRCVLSHNGAINENVTEYLENALKATETYHYEILHRLDQGEDEAKICKDKADWVCSLGALASYEIIQFLCSLLLKHSVAEREKDLFAFPYAKAV